MILFVESVFPTVGLLENMQDILKFTLCSCLNIRLHSLCVRVSVEIAILTFILAFQNCSSTPKYLNSSVKPLKF